MKILSRHFQTTSILENTLERKEGASKRPEEKSSACGFGDNAESLLCIRLCTKSQLKLFSRSAMMGW